MEEIKEKDLEIFAFTCLLSYWRYIFSPKFNLLVII